MFLQIHKGALSKVCITVSLKRQWKISLKQAFCVEILLLNILIIEFCT